MHCASKRRLHGQSAFQMARFLQSFWRAAGFMTFASQQSTGPTITTKKTRVAVIASLAPSLTNFRIELLKRMVGAGHEVFALAPNEDQKTTETLNSLGIKFIQIPMSRTGLNPFADLATLHALWKQFRLLKPDFIMPYTMKPIIYGGIAGRIANIPNRCFLVTGLACFFKHACVLEAVCHKAHERFSLQARPFRCQGCIRLQRCRRRRHSRQQHDNGQIKDRDGAGVGCRS